jgi:hypothetical protein
LPNDKAVEIAGIVAYNSRHGTNAGGRADLRFFSFLIFSWLIVSVATFSASGFAASPPPHSARGLLPHRKLHEEWFSLDRVVLEPLEWPGNLNKAIDRESAGGLFV